MLIIVKILFRARSQNNTSHGSLTLGDVSCMEDGDELADCNVKILKDSCDYNQSVWLKCSNSLGG